MDANGRLVEKAFRFARTMHKGQFRKGGKIAYIEHPVAVMELVRAAGGGVDELQAALLHDTIEDCKVPPEEIALQFGPEVAAIVLDCTDDATLPWRQRKLKYVAHLAEASAATRLVACADKFHNAHCIVRDLALKGEAATWAQFTSGKEGVLWYYDALAKALASVPQLGGALVKMVKVMRDLAQEDNNA